MAVDQARKIGSVNASVFGSAIRDDFRPGSDVDVLIEFEPGQTPGLKFFWMQEELSRLFNRRVDLHTPASLSRHFRSQVLSEAEDRDQRSPEGLLELPPTPAAWVAGGRTALPVRWQVAAKAVTPLPPPRQHRRQVALQHPAFEEFRVAMHGGAGRIWPATLTSPGAHPTLLKNMRRVFVAVVVLAFAAAYVQSPWLHVHESALDSDHYRNQHVGLSAVHGHGHEASAAGPPEWRDNDPDGDAHFFGPVKGVRVAQVVVHLIATPVHVAAQPTLPIIGRQVELAYRAHGPPGLESLPSRAPPA